MGQVIDAVTGKPLRDAIVSITAASQVARNDSPSPPSILTAADGYFVFRDLARGTFVIRATKQGYIDGLAGRRRPGGPSQPVSLTDGQRVGSVAVLMEARRIHGHGRGRSRRTARQRSYPSVPADDRIGTTTLPRRSYRNHGRSRRVSTGGASFRRVHRPRASATGHHAASDRARGSSGSHFRLENSRTSCRRTPKPFRPAVAITLAGSPTPPFGGPENLHLSPTFHPSAPRLG